jgi:hypothetical protein
VNGRVADAAQVNRVVVQVDDLDGQLDVLVESLYEGETVKGCESLFVAESVGRALTPNENYVAVLVAGSLG